MENFLRITTLALADSVNPCELAMLALILITILIHNPGKKSKVLQAGFAFVAAVFIGYLAYGIIIIQFFTFLAEFLRQNTTTIYTILAIIAMVLGALNIKDFFAYKKGGFATEMPLFMRPKMKKYVEKVTSAKGAFFIGFILTLFLLPCTMGPYIVASGLLADLGILGSLPWLLYYNLIFVLPMIIIVLLIYFGTTRVEDVSMWRDKNVRWLHLVAGILLFVVGFAMLMGWI